MPRGNSCSSIFGNTEAVLADSLMLPRTSFSRASPGVVVGSRLRFIDVVFDCPLPGNPDAVLAGAPELDRARFGGASSGVVVALSLRSKGLVGAIDLSLLYSGNVGGNRCCGL
jgi:hypothetical protein